MLGVRRKKKKTVDKAVDFHNGKEECARETQEGCLAPFKSTVFRTLKSSENLLSGAKRLFRRAEKDAPQGVLSKFSIYGQPDQSIALADSSSLAISS